MDVSVGKERKWWQWFAPEDTKEHRRLILKLDLLIVPYVALSYWVKTLDQNNINNAYVSGLKEDLGFYGNQLVQMQSIYLVGAVLGQLPSMALFTRVPMHWLIPAMDIGWGIFTLLQYRANSYSELMAYRFMVGWFESAFFPAVHFVLGSWYRGDEIARRGGFFYLGNTLGGLTAGLIQAAASERLDGVHGLAGWRWMFIICTIITLPVGLIGIVLLPGTVDRPNLLILSRKDVELGNKRLSRHGHQQGGKTNFGTIKKAFKNWQVWAFLLLEVLFYNACINVGSGGFLLWLKSLKRYSTPRLNTLSSIPPALGLFYILFVCFTSDLLWGPAWSIAISHTWNAIGCIILIVWNVPDSALFFAFFTTYSSLAMSSVLYGWVNSQMRYSAAERGFVLLLYNMISQSTTAWTKILTFPTVEGPRFIKGYSFILGCSICLIFLPFIFKYYIDRSNQNPKERQDAQESGAREEDSSDLGHIQPESQIDSKSAVGTTLVRVATAQRHKALEV